MWEVDLTGPQAPRTYLRVEQFDSRRVVPAAPPPAVWDDSPDVRIRPAPGAPLPLAAAARLPWKTGSDMPRFHLWAFQTALHAVDPLCRADGEWRDSPVFWARCLARRARPELNPPPKPGEIVDAVLWADVMTAANAFTEPWVDGPGAGPLARQPTEADMYELILNRQAWVTHAARSRIGSGPARVDVLVHHRHTRPVAGGTVRVTLAWAPLPANGATWPAMPVPWVAGVEQMLRTGGTFGGPVPAPWTIGDAAGQIKQPPGTLEARTPVSVTFDLDLSAAAFGTVLILVAVAHSEADKVTLTGATLRDLVVNNRHVAARSVEVSGTGT